MYTCPKCRIEKPDSQFYLPKNGGRRKTYSCKSCEVEYRTRKRRADPEPSRRASRRSSLGRNYGLTVAEWDALFAAQGSKCAVCATPETRGKGWQTDHCHGTGKVRGILCHDCNLAVGWYERRIRPQLAEVEGYLTAATA